MHRQFRTLIRHALGRCLDVEVYSNLARSIEGGPTLHDPCAVARGGMTVVDFTGRLGRAPTSSVATGLKASAFWDLVLGALTRLG